ncbi:hypothetical protein CS542_00060 [Pedobacter sp. IW39]|nr:hypothetical protein CS542_00060 [Pedobacter sp. IW39]
MWCQEVYYPYNFEICLDHRIFHQGYFDGSTASTGIPKVKVNGLLGLIRLVSILSVATTLLYKYLFLC